MEAALDVAVDNFARWRSIDGDADSVAPGVLWLVEGAGEGASSRLRRLGAGRWRLDELDDVTWRLERTDGARLTLIRGRQCATVEGLEILIVGTGDPVPDGRPLLDVVGRWIDRPVLVMLPWAFGKWTGRRGRVVREAFDAFEARGLRLADTAARPGWAPMPRMLRRAAERDRLVPAGSDPFPFAGCIDAVGRYGFRAPPVAPDAAWPTMLQAIRRMDRTDGDRFGRRMGTAEFAILQARMQLRKQLSGKA